MVARRHLLGPDRRAVLGRIRVGRKPQEGERGRLTSVQCHCGARSLLALTFPGVTSRVSFDGATLTDVLFRGARLDETRLKNVTWNNVTCPDGSVTATGGTCLGHLE